MAGDAPDLGRQAGRFDPPDADGFRLLRAEEDRFHHVYGPVAVRAEGGEARCRMMPGRRHTNPFGAIHGGFLTAFADLSLFLGPAILGRLALGPAVTLTLNTQFILPGRTGEPLDAVLAVTGETGRLLFVRGRMEQAADIIATFDGTLRKLPGATPA